MTEKDEGERGLEYRHWLMGEVDRLMAGPEKPHLFDVLAKLRVPRANFLANSGHPVIAKWLADSRDRVLLNPVPGGLPDLEAIKTNTVMGLSLAGLDYKLEQMVAQADPTTPDGQQLILKLADLRSKHLPKTTKVETDKGPKQEEIAAELNKLRARRQALLDKQADAARENESDVE